MPVIGLSRGRAKVSTCINTLSKHPTERRRGASVQHLHILHGMSPLEAQALGVVAAGAYRHAHHQIVQEQQATRLALRQAARLVELLWVEKGCVMLSLELTGFNFIRDRCVCNVAGIAGTQNK